jgi:hypothetical protein
VGWLSSGASRLASRRRATSPLSGCGRSRGCAARSSGRRALSRWLRSARAAPGRWHRRDREAGVVERHENCVVEGVQADGDAAQSRIRERPGLAGEQRAVGRQGDVLDAADGGQLRDQALQITAQQRLAAGQPQLAHAQARENPGEPCQFLEGEQVLAGQEDEVPAEHLAGHAVGAAELAAVGDRDPQVPQRARQDVSHRRCPPQVTRNHHQLAFRRRHRWRARHARRAG